MGISDSEATTTETEGEGSAPTGRKMNYNMYKQVLLDKQMNVSESEATTTETEGEKNAPGTHLVTNHENVK